MKSIVRVAILAMTLLMLAGCSRGSQSEPQAQQSDAPAEEAASAAGSSSDCEASESLEISAKDTTYDKECLAAPADEPFKVTFNNTDGFGHSFSVYEKEGGEELFRGEIFSGPKELVNDIPALKAGSYHYQCDVHPFVMQGALKVG